MVVLKQTLVVHYKIGVKNNFAPIFIIKKKGGFFNEKFS